MTSARLQINGESRGSFRKKPWRTIWAIFNQHFHRDSFQGGRLPNAYPERFFDVSTREIRAGSRSFAFLPLCKLAKHREAVYLHHKYVCYPFWRRKFLASVLVGQHRLYVSPNPVRFYSQLNLLHRHHFQQRTQLSTA